MSLFAQLSTVRQAFPGKPTFTADNVPDLEGKVIIVTGSNTGIGKEMARILYAKNAKVYMMARSEGKSRKAIADIKEAVPETRGELEFLELDLADLAAVKVSADKFLEKEQRLDVLISNAGLGWTEPGETTAQGHEMPLGVNCVGPFLLIKLLTPLLTKTVAQPTAGEGSVRVIFVSSSAALNVWPTNMMAALGRYAKLPPRQQYFYSKLGNYLHGAEFARQNRSSGVLAASLNPGNLDSDFWRNHRTVTYALIRTILHPPVYGAYTTLYAAFTPDINLENSGTFVAPWGYLPCMSREMLDATKPKSEGGTGVAADFWAWSEGEVKQYL